MSRFTEPLRAAFDAVSARMEAGEREYGDASWSRSPGALVSEEVDDIIGWSVILRSRLVEMALCADEQTIERNQRLAEELRVEHSARLSADRDCDRLRREIDELKGGAQ